MRNILPVFFILIFGLAYSQSDTIVVHDYTKVMIKSGDENSLLPVTSFGEISQAGFFINEIPEGKIKICNNTSTSLWINGRLVKLIKGCDLFDPSDWFKESDTLFVSLFSRKGLANLECELVIFDDLQVIKDDPKVLRDMESRYGEFFMTAVLILIFLISYYMVSNPSRTAYIAQRTFSMKSSSYEFVNVNTLSGSGVQLAVLLSLLISFLGIHLSQILDLGLIDKGSTYWEMLTGWGMLTLVVFAMLLVKWMVVSTISGLFRFRGMSNFQLFDFINFGILSSLLVFVMVMVDYIVNPISITWFGKGFTVFLIVVLLSFIVWFSLKFLNNSSRKKLLIFSYLCATEIIPAILVFGWFYK